LIPSQTTPISTERNDTDARTKWYEANLPLWKKLALKPSTKSITSETMISWLDLYKVVSAMVPLYVALGLGYGSVRWWKIFTPEQCDAINRLVALFTIPFFTFDFTVRTNPYTMNYRFIAADAVSKIGIILALVAWARWYKKGSYAWSLTCFSLSTLNNTLVVGVPLVMAMYGKWAQDLVVQLSVVQSIVWNATLLFGLELRKAVNNAGSIKATQVKDVEAIVETDSKISLLPLMKTVCFKLARNPNVYASVLGITWSLIANRYMINYLFLF
jgi:auxin efflux carrier family protein